MAVDGGALGSNDVPKAMSDMVCTAGLAFLHSVSLCYQPETARRPLKRRLGGAAPGTQAPAPPQSQLVVEKSSGQEPPHKKFKALFEQSDPDRIASESQVPPSQADAGASSIPSAALSSQTQTESALRTQSRARELASVPEEDVDMDAQPATQHSQKRKERSEVRRVGEVHDLDIHGEML